MGRMVDPKLEWPLSIVDINDPGLTYSASDIVDLAQFVEYWNCPTMPGSDSWRISDARGRDVYGCIEHLEVKSLYLVYKDE